MSKLEQELCKIKSQDLEHELMEKLEDLAEIQGHLSLCLEGQQNQIDTIADNLTLAEIKIEKGVKELKIAQQYSFKYIPIAVGGLVGVAVGGPFGLIPGFKLGGLAMGGVLGATGAYAGYKIQK